MKVASLTETLTVTAESPLVDISSTQVAGNVDRRQMEELPLQGRNWMELAMQVKGITANAVDTTPGVRDRQFQLNLDGQEITQQVAGSGFGQPKFSREAIAEFQVVTNLFDITQGRSLGIQVQAISRSGTNNLDGSVYGYFRDDKLNAKDFIADRVLPYSNQQIGGAIGGPIIRDKLHYFLSYERENEPNTILSVAAVPARPELFIRHQAGAEQLPRPRRLAARLRRTTSRRAGRTGTGTTRSRRWRAPSIRRRRPRARARRSTSATTWANVVSDKVLQEVRVGYSHFDWGNLLNIPALANTPNYVFPGLDRRPAAQLPAGVLPEHLQRPLRPDDEPRHARPQVRRRVPALARHRPVAAAVARRVHLHRQSGGSARGASRPTRGTIRRGGT